MKRLQHKNLFVTDIYLACVSRRDFGGVGSNNNFYRKELTMTEPEQAQCEMPKYKSHKEVHALEIASVEKDIDKAQEDNRETDGTAMIYPVDRRYAPFKVEANYVNKHNPQAGGYYVVYEDGYESWSPKEAFESGYTLITEQLFTLLRKALRKWGFFYRFYLTYDMGLW